MKCSIRYAVSAGCQSARPPTDRRPRGRPDGQAAGAPSRRTRLSPTRTVTRWVSSHSSSGIAYFREMPEEVLDLLRGDRLVLRGGRPRPGRPPPGGARHGSRAPPGSAPAAGPPPGAGPSPGPRSRRARAWRRPPPGSAAPPPPPGTRPRSDPTRPAGRASGGRRGRPRAPCPCRRRAPRRPRSARAARGRRAPRGLPSRVRSSSFDIPGLSGSRAWNAASAAAASGAELLRRLRMDVPLPVHDEDALLRHQRLEVPRGAPPARTPSAPGAPPCAPRRRRRAGCAPRGPRPGPRSRGSGGARARAGLRRAFGRGDVQELAAADRHHRGVAPDDVPVPGQRHDRRLETQLDVALLPWLDGGRRHRVHARHHLARPDVEAHALARLERGRARRRGARTSRRACRWAGGGPAARARRRARSPRARRPGGSPPRAGRRPRPRRAARGSGCRAPWPGARGGTPPRARPGRAGRRRPSRSPPSRTPGS